jgi:hypothetical protein
VTSRDGASVVILVADGARPDTLAAAMDRGDLPALARLRSEGGFHEITSVFPSVTGAAYTPFLLGRYPGPVGIPGIRWFDRGRSVTRWPSWSRSYMGVHLHAIDSDLDDASPTLFDLASSRLGALSFIERGLPARDNVVSGARFFFRAAFTHFFGSLAAWTALDRAVCMEGCARLARDKPELAFIVVASIDKASHAHGHDSVESRTAMRTVDEAVARIRADAERDGRWDQMHLMVVSDHGHSPVRSHEDLAGLIESWGAKVRAHPWTWGFGQRAAVMVSGNAMAHLYLDLQSRTRRFWPDHAGEWEWLAQKLLQRESTDLLILPHSPTEVEIRARSRGAARLRLEQGRYSYRCDSGDPLGIGELRELDDSTAYEVALRSDYPDAFAQLLALCGSERCGDLLISASRDWDLRAKWEPVTHVSSHGALHREHMMVPLLVNRPVAQIPRRTVDVFATAVAALGLKSPATIDGESWL